jgi:transposase-like protein
MQLRKVLRNRGHFPSDEAATKPIYLALRNVTKKWKNPPITWKLAATQLRSNSASDFLRLTRSKNQEKVESCFQRLE